MKIIKYILSIYFLLINLLLNIPCMVVAYFSRGDFKYSLIQLAARIFFLTTFSRIKVHGLEKLKTIDNKSIVYFSNHQSLFDIPVVVGWIDKSVSFVARDSLNKYPILSTWMKILECEFLDRQVSRKELLKLRHVANRISEGKHFLLFPEGTRTRDGNINRFKAGVDRIIKNNDFVIVPLFIDGTFKIMQPEKLYLTPSTVNIYVGEPLQNKDFAKGELSEEVYNWMKDISDNKSTNKSLKRNK